MSTNDATLTLDGDLTVATAAACYRTWLPRLAGIATFDLGGLHALDSAGVSTVLALRRQAERLNGRAPTLAILPIRFRQLCVAHRVDLNGI